MKCTKGKKKEGLGVALEECREAAQDGYKIAYANLKDTGKEIEKVSGSLQKSLRSVGDSSVRTPEVVRQLKDQLTKVVSDLNELQRTSEKILADQCDRLDRFTITLFGRTKAGKSTLMEILTNGDGGSIGNGSQRTTRDVREYSWKGLSVIDVPGIAAFEGKEDEDLAFEAATHADLVLFLITDDSFQPAEAECLARVRRLGKPLLGICNVKASIRDAHDMRRFLKRPEQVFDPKCLKEYLNQVDQSTDKFAPGTRIKFTVAHLDAKYLSGLREFRQHRSELSRLSKFYLIEKRIISAVRRNGKFLRVKTFVDGATAPMMDFTGILLEFSEKNSTSGRVLIGKRDQLTKWTNGFRESGKKKILTCISRLMESLRNEVPAFSERYYDSSSAGSAWEQEVKNVRIDPSIESLQSALVDECQSELNEIARELKSELNIVADLSSDKQINMASIFDSKRAWNWGTTILAGGIGLAAVILASGPLGWLAAGVGLIGGLVSHLFGDREGKARRAREKLSGQLNEHIDKMKKNLIKSLLDWFSEKLIRGQIDVLSEDLGAVISGLFELADAQRSLAWSLNIRQKKLAQSLVYDLLDLLERKELRKQIVDIARVPGFATMLLIEKETEFPLDVKKEMEQALGERICFAIDTKNEFSILKQAIGRKCDPKKIKIEHKIKVAHVPLDDLDNETLVRIRLAQQLTGLHIMH